METKRGQTDDFIPGDETRQKRRRLARGELQEVKNMPYDIACEICRHLHPKDILLLARRKPFRTTLMNESAKSIWIASRQSYGIPDPIPSMTNHSIQRIPLIFTQIQFCVDGKAQSILWFSSAEELCQAGVDLSNIEDLVPYHYLDRKSKIPKWHGVRWIYLTSAAKALFDEYEKSEREGPVALSAFMDRKKSERQAALAGVLLMAGAVER
ncbi:hypothetical protein MPER_09857 [Moniliophthora perniciosa FA553]|nr:hypothetical protein MPER_09857 [Moniliophthora perniciosa FA553]